MADTHHALTRSRLIAIETKPRRALSGRGVFAIMCSGLIRGHREPPI